VNGLRGTQAGSEVDHGDRQSDSSAYIWARGCAFRIPSRAQAATAPINSVSQEVDPASVVSTSPAQAEMAPPKAPKVTCIGDQLTISADNSTLGGVLAAVHNCTGVKVDIPEGAASSRVFEELGPGPARQVLEALLSGTELDYVIGSSSSDPQKIETYC